MQSNLHRGKTGTTGAGELGTSSGSWETVPQAMKEGTPWPRFESFESFEFIEVYQTHEIR